MRVEVLKDGSWEISGLREIELRLLQQVAEAASPGDCDSARARLYPDPVSPEEKADDEGGSNADWEELVVPELEGAFAEAVERVRSDLARPERREEKGEPVYRVKIPSGHAEEWYSALNQARLVLAERHRLPMSDSEFDAEDAIIDERWMANAQSNIYAFIQTFLLETVMKLP